MLAPLNTSSLEVYGRVNISRMILVWVSREAVRSSSLTKDSDLDHDSASINAFWQEIYISTITGMISVVRLELVDAGPSALLEWMRVQGLS